VDDVVRVELLEGENDAGGGELGLFFTEHFPAGNMQSEVSSCQQVHDQEEGRGILEREVHVDNKIIFEVDQQFTLVHDTVCRLLGDHLDFIHFLHCLLLTILGVED